MVRNFYLVQTGHVTKIDETGVWFTARITNKTSEAVKDHGFVWSFSEKNPQLGNALEKSLGPDPVGSSFDAFISEELLERDTIIYIRAYLTTDTYISYGPSAQLIYNYGVNGNLPVITSIQPNPMVWKDTIIIKGENFSTDPAKLSVVIKLGNENFPLNIIKSSIHEIRSILPVFVSVNKPGINVKNSFGESGYTSFNIMPPIIDSISPESGKAPLTVRLYGRNLGFGYVTANVYFNQTLATAQVSSQGVQIVSLPSGLPAGPVNVTASFIGLTTVKQNFFTILP